MPESYLAFPQTSLPSAWRWGAEQGETNASRMPSSQEIGRALGMFIDKQGSIQVSYADELDSL